MATDRYRWTFNAIASEDMDILTAYVVNYAKQSAQTTRLAAMELNLQPRAENYANNAVYQPPMGPPMRYGAQ